MRDGCLFYSVLYAENFSRFPANICIINGLLFICNSNLKMEEFEEGEGTINISWFSTVNFIVERFYSKILFE